MEIVTNFILLFLDIVLYLVWFGYYIYLITLPISFQPYRNAHVLFLGHLLATLRLVNLTEIENYNLKKPFAKLPTFFWWNFATFAFAILYDFINLMYVIFDLSQIQQNAYNWELTLSCVFLGMSCSIFIWFICKYFLFAYKKKGEK